MEFNYSRSLILFVAVLILNCFYLVSLRISYIEKLAYDDYVSSTIYSTTTFTKETEEVFEYLESLETSEMQPVKSRSSRQIFFIETSHPEGGALDLNERKSCAIESAAKLHPDYNIFVLVIGEAVIEPNRNRTKLYLDLINNNNNIFFRRVTIEEFTKDTPVLRLFQKRKMRKSRYFTVYTADILRLVALWKFGGLYFDTDVVVLKNFKDLGENFLCVASPSLVMTGTMQFSGEGPGHEVVGTFLKALAKSFRTKTWASNGPVFITNQMKRVCNVTDAKSMIGRECEGITFLNPQTFLPISYRKHKYYFDPVTANLTMSMLKNSYTAHIFNHMNAHIKLPTNSSAAYVRLAQRYCPNTFQSLGDYF